MTRESQRRPLRRPGGDRTREGRAHSGGCHPPTGPVDAVRWPPEISPRRAQASGRGRSVPERAGAHLPSGLPNQALQRTGGTAVVCGAVVQAAVGGGVAPAAEFSR